MNQDNFMPSSQKIRSLKELEVKGLKFVFSDIDDTMTSGGKLSSEVYSRLWDLNTAGLILIPVTGRPAGWCEMIARTWPVYGVVGENGALFYKYENKKMNRTYVLSPDDVQKKKLDLIKEKILQEVPTVSVATDQFCRLFDLAIDFAEDVSPQPQEVIHKIVKIFEDGGATAKVSSIHVNGWYGDFNKLSMCETVLKENFNLNLSEAQPFCTFIGDSPNDEPLFEAFDNSVGVANAVLDSLKHPPKFLTQSDSSRGFIEFANHILQACRKD